MTADTTHRPPVTSTSRPRLAALLAGTAVASITHLLALAAGVDMLVPAFDGGGTQQIVTVGVAASAATAVLLGWAAAVAAGRLSSRPRAVWLAAAALGLALSFVPVVAIEATLATQVVLAVQHLLVAAAVIPLFVQTLPVARRPRIGRQFSDPRPTSPSPETEPS